MTVCQSMSTDFTFPINKLEWKLEHTGGKVEESTLK